MANGLTTLKVKSLKEPGRYGDGNGLYLEVSDSGAKKWTLRIQHGGKRRDLGLGGATDVSLSDARAAAEKIRKQVRDGLDPVAERKKASAPAPTIPTFRECALIVLGEHAPTWKNAKHAAQWISTLERYAFPALGDKSVDQITGPEVRDVLAAIWLTIPETARRVRQRVGVVLDWAHAKGYRPAEAPMKSVNKGLPKQPKGQEHFEAMPWQEVPEFLVKLDASDKAGPAVKLLLKFLILTAVRSGEARGATWGEIDMEAALWTVPAARMKMSKAHVVPLAGATLDVLKSATEMRTGTDPGDLVFPGVKLGRPVSDMSMTMFLRRNGFQATMHGFRSSFRDWAGEATNFPREVCEAALAHVVGGKVERAYARSDLLEKRRKLMDAWARHCTGSKGKVVQMTSKRSA